MVKERLVQAVCADCGRGMRAWGGPYMAPVRPDGSAPIARMWGGNYTHEKDENGRCKR